MPEKIYTHKSHEGKRPEAEIEDHSDEKLDELVESSPAEQAEESSNKTEVESQQNEAEVADKLEEARDVVEEEAKPAAETESLQMQDEDQAAPATPLVNRSIKDEKFNRTLTSVRKSLNAPERAFSKLVHNKTVDAVSNAADKTVARPSGLLTGSIFSFLGSVVFLYIARHYGYEYNFLLFFLFFVGGFFVGLFLEAIIRLVYHPKA